MAYKDPEKRRACQRKYDRRKYWEDPEKARQEAREQYAKHKDRLKVENAERNRIKAKEWNAKHPERRLAMNQRWQESHKDKVREINRRWFKNHPEVTRHRRNQRRAAETDTVYSLTKEQESELLKSGCFFCGSHDDLSIAHDVPVSKGGHTTRGNVFCLCRPCNARMNTKNLAQTIKQLLFPF